MSNPEKMPKLGGQGQEKKGSNDIMRFSSPENQSRFEKMKERAKEIVRGLCEKSSLGTIIDKLKISYSQHLIERGQNKVDEHKAKMDALDLSIMALEDSEKRINEIIADSKKKKIPGAESLERDLQKDLQKIDKKKMSLESEKRKTQLKLEAMERQIKLYTNERDRVVNKFIERYNEKLRPLENNLEKLYQSKEKANFEVTAKKAECKGMLLKLDEIEKEKNELEERLRNEGYSEKKIKKLDSVKTLEKIVKEYRKKVQAAEAKLEQRGAEIEKKIVETEAKVNLYKNKQEEFIRIKEGKPIKREVSKREKGKEEKPKVEVYEREGKKEKLYKVSTLFENWNTIAEEILGEKSKFIFKETKMKEFLNSAKYGESTMITLEDFIGLLKMWLEKIKGIKISKKVNEALKKFEKGGIKKSESEKSKETEEKERQKNKKSVKKKSHKK